MTTIKTVFVASVYLARLRNSTRYTCTTVYISVAPIVR